MDWEAQISIAKVKDAEINPGMFGLFFEDINYAADGGLFAELIENRSFEAMTTLVDNEHKYKYEYRHFPGYGWKIRRGTVGYSTDEPLCDTNTHYAKIGGSEHGAALVNKAYDGICLKKGLGYDLSLWVRRGGYRGSIKAKVTLGGRVCLECTFEAAEEKRGDWEKYTAHGKASADVRGAEFSLDFEELHSCETVDIDMVSMIPSDAVMGVFRRDIAEALKALKPGFLRFPGGCAVEGYDLKSRYRWKESVGAPETRRQNRSRWAASDPRFANYNQTLGLGFYEYFLLCEYLECRPVPVLNAGMGCQYNCADAVPLSGRDGYSDEFEQYLSDALHLIEFANGAPDTVWGGLRCEMGHEQPFDLEIIGIGNEQWEGFDRSGKPNLWHERYEAFEKVIHEKYPYIKLICSAGPDVKSDKYVCAWDWIRKRFSENSSFTYAVDEHYYDDPDWFFENDGFYDAYSRDIKVFAGEYASRRKGEHENDMLCALSEAAFLTGLERNADVVCMASYAPLLARRGYNQWQPNLIWFDDRDVCLTPDYYVQKLYAGNMGDYTLKTKILSKLRLYCTASYDEKRREIIVKLVNRYPRSVSVRLRAEGFDVGYNAELFYISGSSVYDRNTFDEPGKICQQQIKLRIRPEDILLDLKPLSLSVIRLAAE